MTAARGELVFVGDVHLDRDDPDLEPFLAFLHRLEGRADRVVLAGDLFNLWLGDRALELPHQRLVLERLVNLRRRGVVVRYLEGNRDFHLRRAYVGTALDEATDRGVVERWGGRSLFAVHGDLANREDRQYRAWRRLARSRATWLAFRSLPPGRRLRLAEGLEARLRATNLEHKEIFPEEEVRRYAVRHLDRGFDAVVLGHFHVEKDLHAESPSPAGRILVLPLWKASRRHLRVSADGEISFVNSE